MRILGSFLMILAGVGLTLLAASRVGLDLAAALPASGEDQFVRFEEVDTGLPAQAQPAAASAAGPLKVNPQPIEGLSASFAAPAEVVPLTTPAEDLPEQLPGVEAQIDLLPDVSSQFFFDDAAYDGTFLQEGPFLLEGPFLQEGPFIEGGAFPAEGAALPEAGRPAGEVPLRLVIPTIELDAPILPARAAVVIHRGQEYRQWVAPERFAAGWHYDSALLGLPGNTVLNGHHNNYGEVFRDLVDLNVGDLLYLYSDEKEYVYQINNKMILPEKYEQPEVRRENARWIHASEDERITLVTCWPYETNTHRLIIVASPVR
jgi:LPXTG-site transpeptidase (sortase) family protein